ncbi:rod shape-determining protein MreD [candidate division WOR-3 bacterium]|nr:rod shape-determining protein MreD [candidate division WOR-3 bacterium]
MRQFLAFVFLYLLFVLQSTLFPIGPQVVLLALIVFALYENRLTATLLGIWAGLCLDLVTPTTLGVQMLALGGVGYGVAAVRNLFYRNRWHNLLFTLIGLILQYGLYHLVDKSPITIGSLLLTTTLTLALTPVAEPALVALFYRHSKR